MKKIITTVMVLSSVISFAQAGRVGINIESPTATFTIKSKEATLGERRGAFGGRIVSKNLELKNIDDVNLLTVLNNGNVGIGVDNPIAPLSMNVKTNGLGILIKDENSKEVFKVNGNGGVEVGGRYIGVNGDETQAFFGGYKHNTDGLNVVHIGSTNQDVNRVSFSNSATGKFMGIHSKYVNIEGDRDFDKQLLLLNVRKVSQPFGGMTVAWDWNGEGDRPEKAVDLGISEDGKWSITGSNKSNIVGDGGNIGIGTGTNTIGEKLEVAGGIKVSTTVDYARTYISNNATTPIPTGGAGTIIFQNGHFFGWTGTNWKQLDNN